MKKRNKRPEDLIQTQVSNHIRTTYPNVVFRFDLAASMVTTIGVAVKNKQLHGKFHKSYPDLFIAKCVGKYGGLYLELKKDTKSGEVPNTEHTRKQAVMLELLRQSGYKTSFAVGADVAKRKIDEYLKKRARK
jgi:hypothetical protein